MFHPRGIEALTYSVCLVPQKVGLLSAIWHSFLSVCNNRKVWSVLIESSMYHMYCETTRVHIRYQWLRLQAGLSDGQWLNIPRMEQHVTQIISYRQNQLRHTVLIFSCLYTSLWDRILYKYYILNQPSSCFSKIYTTSLIKPILDSYCQRI